MRRHVPRSRRTLSTGAPVLTPLPVRTAAGNNLRMEFA